MKILRLMQRAATLLLFIFVAPLRSAELDFPTKPIHLLVGYGASSGADVVARLLAAKMQESWKDGIFVENRPGAGGMLASQQTIRAAPDGYTLMLGAMPQIVIAPATNPALPYDPVQELAPVSQLVGTDLVLIINPNKVPANTMQTFVNWARDQTVVFFGTPGPGTVGHFGAYFFANAAQVQIEPVHFRSTADALSAMLNGDIHAQFVPFAVAAPLVKAGRLRALLVTGPQRTPMFPDTPTSREAGYPNVQFSSWYGVFAPAGTPANILEKLSTEIVNATTSDDLRARLSEVGLRVTGTDRATFTHIIREDAERWGEIVKATGFTSKQ